MFLLTFVAFIACSYAMYYTTNEVGDFANDYDAGVGTQVNTFYNNLISYFQIIFLILAIGCGLFFVLAIMYNKNEQQGGYYG